MPALLEGHDPLHVSALGLALRRPTEEGLSRVYAGRVLRSTLHAGRLIEAILAVSPGLAFPLTTARSGFVREAAVSAIGSVPGPFCLSLLTLRANDPVGEVRRAAARKLADFAREGLLPAEFIVECAGLLLDAERFGPR